MKKIYTTRYSKLSLELECNGISAVVEFKNGRMTENIPARFITSDPFLQYLIEHDKRYGSLFRLEKTITEKSDVKGSVDNKKIKGKDKVPDAKIVDSVRDLTDAIDYFSGMGKMCTNSKQVKALMQDYNISFPNWK